MAVKKDGSGWKVMRENPTALLKLFNYCSGLQNICQYLVKSRAVLPLTSWLKQVILPSIIRASCMTAVF